LSLLRKIASNFLQTIQRFPIPILSGMAAFVCMYIELHWIKRESNYAQHYTFIKLFLASVSGISLFTAFDIFSESKNVQKSKRFGLVLLGFCILGLHFYTITPGMFDAESIFVSRYLIFIVCFHLMVSFVAFFSATEINSFWQYNYFLFTQLLTSLFYSLTLFIGIGSGVWAVDHLFGIHIHADYYVDIAVFIFCVLNTIFFLMGFPNSFELFKPKQEFKKSIRIFVQYILLPIVGSYILILYIYMFKIVMHHKLPNGWVCIPILIFSFIGILAYLLIYPIRKENNNRFIYIYAKYFFYILLPLLSLYFIAIYHRIMPYGITEDRYLIFVLGIWLAIISVYIILSKRDNIIVIPVSLFLLLAMSAIGPWGMFQLSEQNQFIRLGRLLKKNHLLENNELINKGSKLEETSADYASIRSILYYLHKRGELKKVLRWLNDKEHTAIKKAIEKDEFSSVNAILNLLNIKPNAIVVSQYIFLSDENDLYQRTMNIEGYHHISRFDIYSNELEQKDLSITDSAKLNYRLVDNTFNVFKQSDTICHIHLDSFMHTLIRYYQEEDSLNISFRKTESSFQMLGNGVSSITLPNDSMIVEQNGTKLVFKNMEMQRRDSLFDIIHIDAFLLY
jgi:hypothetical protein